jgi:hypothetical protein
MTPKDYFNTICQPTYEKFIADPTSTLHAWTAVAALFHLRDWLAKDHGVSPSVMQTNLEGGCPQFRAIADIANASKHFELDRGRRKGLSANDFAVGRGAAFSDGSYYSDGSSHSDAPDVLRMEFNGERIDILNLCKQAHGYLKTQV